MRSRYSILLAAAAVALAACNRTPEPASSNLDFPARPDDTPFYNASSITEANFETVGNLDRAREMTGIDFAMVLLDRIPGEKPVETFAAELFDHWRVGGQTGGKGVLFIFVESDHTMKIEVAYELEEVFTDAFCGAYQESVRTYFAGRYFGDVMSRLILDMVERYRGNDVDPALLLAGTRPDEILDTSFLSGGAGAVESRYFYDKHEKLAAILKAPEDLVAQFDAADSPEKTVELYFDSMERGLNYPFLGILTEGSHFMRLEYPKTKYFLAKSARKYRAALPMKILRQGDLAIARFADRSVIPLLLRRRPDDKWVIDVTKSWALIQATDDLTEMYPLYRDHPWMFGFREYSFKTSHVELPDLLPFPENLESRIAALEKRVDENPETAAFYFELASLLYFECYWIRAAIDLIEEGLKHDPENVSARWQAIYMRHRFPILEGVPKHYELLLGLTPEDKTVWRNFHHFCQTYSKDKKRAAQLERDYRKRFGKKL